MEAGALDDQVLRDRQVGVGRDRPPDVAFGDGPTEAELREA